MIKQHYKSVFVVLLFTLWTSTFVVNSAAAQEDMTEEKWILDIQHYAKQLEIHHIDLFHTISRDEFNDQVDLLISELPTLSDNQILVKLMRLTSMIGDGHTSFPLWGIQAHEFPVRFINFDGELYVESTTKEYAYLLGAKLKSINNNSVNNILPTLEKVVPFSENIYSTSVRSAHYMSVAEVLNGAGFIENTKNAEFIFERAKETIRLDMHAKRRPEFEHNYAKPHIIAKHSVTKVNDNLWFSVSADKKAVYVKFASYADFNSMTEFSQALLDFINKNTSEQLIIDLRDNFGGDFFAGLTIAQRVVQADSIDWLDGVFVLTNNVTFSAAMSNAAQFKRLLNATIVGTPTGAKPSGYQDMGQFTLPYTKAVVSYSKRYYDFLGIDSDAIYPDVLIIQTAEDFAEQKDPQLEWVLKHIDWTYE